VPLATILARYHILGDLKRIGAQHFGCCPIHKGTNKKQFVCDLNKGTWFCFGDCRKGGDALALVSELENVDMRAAAALIATWFALGTTARDGDHRKPKERAMSGNRPTHKVFAVRDGDPDDPESKAWYTRIGSAWPHKSGKGMSILLDALPVNERLVLFEYDEDDAKEDEAKKAKFTGKKK
jgi:hypothetical protein